MSGVFAILVGLLVSLPAFALKNQCATFDQAVSKAPAAAQFKSFLDVQWKYFMKEYPEWATFVGYPGQDDRWSDASLASIAHQKTQTKCQLAALKKINRLALKGEERVSYDLALSSLELEIEGMQFPSELMPVNQMNGIQIDAATVLRAMPTATAKDVENIIKRLERLPALVAQIEILMREGMKVNAMPIKSFMPKVSAQVDELLSGKAEDNPLLASFKNLGPNFSAQQKEEFSNQAKQILQTKIQPAFRKFKEFLNNEYMPKARESIAWIDLPNGKAWYAYMVKRSTTTNQTPDQLHELGLQEVERITKEMELVKDKAKFKGDLKAFFKFLKNDKQFYFQKPEELLMGFREVAKRIDPELPKFFKTLPRLTYGVRAMADAQAKSGAAAQYMSGTLETGRAGYFEANTFDLPSRPKWEMETLTMHEAVPGHHFQIAIAQELTGLPEFRRHGGYTAYSEGWALYAESLGDEMGFYKDPYSKFGNLSAEMMRAVRLVVDTGMHSKGWTQAKALEYFRSKFPVGEVDSSNEINRYISWPGQALAYKVGQLKIRELREFSKKQLGDSFDLREFHDKVLKHGALPMDVLEITVKEWVSASLKSVPRKKIVH